MATDIITLKEFISPHVYNYGECMVRLGKVYQCINTKGTDGRTGYKAADWREITSGGGGGSSNGYFPQGWG